jgi:hypothetical protein
MVSYKRNTRNSEAWVSILIVPDYLSDLELFSFIFSVMRLKISLNLVQLFSRTIYFYYELLKTQLNGCLFLLVLWIQDFALACQALPLEQHLQP